MGPMGIAKANTGESITVLPHVEVVDSRASPTPLESRIEFGWYNSHTATET